MESTPLELYEKAYRLHYIENRPEAAVSYYQRLIKEFSDSNECGYAVIQLQKIKAEEVAAGLQSALNARNQNFYLLLLIFISLAAAGMAFAASGIFYRSLVKRIEENKKILSLSLNAISKISNEEYDDAIKQLSELKDLYKGNILPWKLSAIIYLKQNRFDEARKEYVTFFQLNPDQKPTESELKFMEFKGRAVEEKSAIKSSPLLPTSSKTLPPPPEVSKKPASLRSKQIQSTPPPPPPVQRKQKKSGLLLVDPDSISFF